MWIATEFMDFFQPTIQPTAYDVLYDFRVFWQSPRSCKLLRNLTMVRGHGRGREFESRRPRHNFLKHQNFHQHPTGLGCPRAFVCVASEFSPRGHPLGILRREFPRDGAAYLRRHPPGVFMRWLLV